MIVFVTGATGYIGTAVVQALRGAGHEVRGLARSPAAAEKLEFAGVEAVEGALTELTVLARAMLNAVEGTGKPFIYTSGVWVLGNTGDVVADEDAPLDPSPLVGWRAEVEGTMRDAAAWGTFVSSARRKGVVRYVGDGTQRWPFVHVDDLADLYVLALDAPAGTLLNAAAGLSLPVREVAEAAAQANGATVEAWPLDEAREVLGVYADALALDQQVAAERAAGLGWNPSRPSVLDELRTGSYVASAPGGR
jgi:nucleoside-diphosphate-sugar epimerase